MENIKQNYIPGEPFNTYVLSDLTAYNAEDWTWTGRTLKGYKTDLCASIPLGGEITINETQSSISGIWELKRYTLSTEGVGAVGVTLCCLGTTGGITMSISARNDWTPLADASHPYEQQLSVTQTSCITGFYIGTSLSIKITPDPGTSIKFIQSNSLGDNSNMGSDNVSEQNGYIYIDNYPQTLDENSIFNSQGYPIAQGSTHLGYLQSGGCIISVDYAEGGYLEYFSNKNTRNPDA